MLIGDFLEIVCTAVSGSLLAALRCYEKFHPTEWDWLISFERNIGNDNQGYLLNFPIKIIQCNPLM